MKYHPFNYAVLFSFSQLTALTSQAGELMQPSYKEQRQQFYEQSKKSSKADPFSEEEKWIMKQAGNILAIKLPDPGLKAGTKAPDFRLNNAFGKSVHLYDELKKGPVILVFYRGAWCPFCNLHLHALQKSLDAFQKYNAQLITITPQKPDKSIIQIKKDKFPFEVLSDLDSEVMKSYRLFYEMDEELVKVYKKHGLNVEEYNGKGRNVLPVPGTYVIDKRGFIRGVHANIDYKERMEPQMIVNILKQL